MKLFCLFIIILPVFIYPQDYCIDSNTIPKEFKYGPHENNKLDLWRVESDQSTPLVIFFHGGGFSSGDKSLVCTNPKRFRELRQFLDAGISFASVNYRYHQNHEKGMLGSIADCRRALQMIKLKSDLYNINSSKIGIYGSSAGGGIALLIAFSDDMSATGDVAPYLKESTRVQVVGALATQSTYDILQWPQILNLGNNPTFYDSVYNKICYDVMINRMFGNELRLVTDLTSDYGITIRNKIDILSKISSDDPPVWIQNVTPSEIPSIDHPQFSNIIIHHPLHAAILYHKAEEANIENYVYAPGAGFDLDDDEKISIVEFFKSYLLDN